MPREDANRSSFQPPAALGRGNLPRGGTTMPDAGAVIFAAGKVENDGRTLANFGAAFATVEMKTVLREVVARYALEPAGEAVEVSRRRSITISPRRGAATILRARAAAPRGAPRSKAAPPARASTAEPSAAAVR